MKICIEVSGDSTGHPAHALSVAANKAALWPALQPALLPALGLALRAALQPVLLPALRPALRLPPWPALQSATWPALQPALQPAPLSALQPALQHAALSRLLQRLTWQKLAQQLTQLRLLLTHCKQAQQAQQEKQERLVAVIPHLVRQLPPVQLVTDVTETLLQQVVVVEPALWKALQKLLGWHQLIPLALGWRAEYQMEEKLVMVLALKLVTVHLPLTQCIGCRLQVLVLALVLLRHWDCMPFHLPVRGSRLSGKVWVTSVELILTEEQHAL